MMHQHRLFVSQSTRTALATDAIVTVAMGRAGKHDWHKFESNYIISVSVLWCKDTSRLTYIAETRMALKRFYYDDTAMEERAESIERARACNSPREQCGIPAALLKTFQIESQLPKDPNNRL